MKHALTHRSHARPEYADDEGIVASQPRTDRPDRPTWYCHASIVLEIFVSAELRCVTDRSMTCRRMAFVLYLSAPRTRMIITRM
jgi:hypothetical protein